MIKTKTDEQLIKRAATEFGPDDAQNFDANLQDGSRHGGVESLRAIQRKGEAGLLPSNKEEKEKIPNGNL